MTEDELLALGKEVHEDPDSKRMMRHGRPIKNMEMYACVKYLQEERRKADDFLEDEL